MSAVPTTTPVDPTNPIDAHSSTSNVIVNEFVWILIIVAILIVGIIIYSVLRYMYRNNY